MKQVELVLDTLTVNELENPKFDESVQQEFQKTGVLQLWDMPFFAKPTPLFRWLMSRVHEDLFYFVERRMRITCHLIRIVKEHR